MSKKKIIFEIIFFIILTGLTIFYLITSGVFSHIGDLKNVTVLGLFFVLISVLVYVLADSFIIYRSIKKVRGNASYLDGIGVYTFGNLGAAVTPWKSAHFPMIGYYLHKRGYNTEEILSIMARNQLIYSITLPCLYSVFVIYGIINKIYIDVGRFNLPLFIFPIFGIVTNIFYLVVLFTLLYNQKFQNFVCNLEAKVLFKMKKITDKEAFLEEKRIKMMVYKKTADSFFHKYYKNLPSVIAYIIFMLFINGIPYITYLAVSGNHFVLKDYIYCFMLCQAMSYVTNLIPVPGGMAAVEFSFLTVFEPFMGSLVNISLLLYRFFTYIFLIILDFIIFVIFHVLIKIKSKQSENSDIINEMGD